MTRNYILAYDASCGPCSRFKAVVEFLDARRRMRFVSLETADRSGLIEGISPSMRYRSFHLLSSSVGPAEGESSHSGSDALLPLLRLLLPGGAIASRMVEATPGAKGALSFIYAAVSRLHGVGSCAQAARRDRVGPQEGSPEW